MFRSYLRTALRNLTRNKLYSFINVFGLSVGIACCLLLSLYVYNQVSFDKHHADVDQVYRINSILDNGGQELKMASCSPPVAMTMMEEVAGIELATRVVFPPMAGESLIKYNDNSFYEPGGIIADSTVFKVLTYEFIEGNMNSALTHPNSVVVSEQFASRLFGNQSALDKVISITQGGAPSDFKVTGVFKSQKLSHIQANFFTSINSDGWASFLRRPGIVDEWVGNNFVPSYVRLAAGEDPIAVIEKMNSVLMKYAEPKLKSTGRKKALTLEPIKDLYLKSDIGQQPKTAYVYSVFIIGVFILVIACINFMNLSTARASRRAAEIGIRKVMGAFRTSLIRQIMAESMAFVVMSAIIGVGFAWLFLPSFNEVTGSSIAFSDVNAGYIAAGLVAVVLITGLLAGSYPAFYISSFQPAKVLKGKMTEVNAKGWLRRSLVVFQFVVTIVLICGTIVVSRQMEFVRSMPLGYETNAKLVLPLRTDLARENFDELKQQIITNKNINRVGGTDFAPGMRVLYDSRVYPSGANPETAISQQFSPVDTEYMPMMEIKLLSGRHFTAEDAPKDNPPYKVIINKTSAEQLGFTVESAPGSIFSAQHNRGGSDYVVIGVTEDFHQTSLRDRVPATVFYMQSNNRYQNMVLDVSTGNLSETISSIQSAWTSLLPGTPFEFTFVDDSIQKLYTSDRQTATLINSFSAIAIMISCLGLYALSAFMAERRTREIGIRKVMGASVRQVVVMMSSEYVKLVAASLVISVPFAWVALDRWLEGFAYRISIDYTIFIYAGLFAIGVALSTVFFETFKAANANPVKSLKSD